MWPFRKKSPRDCRMWNDDWRVGDTAEVVNGEWSEHVPPWERLPIGAQYTVTGFDEGEVRGGGTLHYFLYLQGFSRGYSTNGFRKVRAVKAEESEVVSRILKAKPGKDRVRENVPHHPRRGNMTKPENPPAPCPHCGAAAIKRQGEHAQGVGCSALPVNCSTVWRNSFAEAIHVWNMRAEREKHQ